LFVVPAEVDGWYKTLQAVFGWLSFSRSFFSTPGFPLGIYSGTFPACDLYMETTDIAIIGAGSAEITIGVEAAHHGLSGKVILEKAQHACDTIISFYRDGKGR